MIPNIFRLIAWSCLLLAPSIQAHHSAAQFDFQNVVTVTGVIKQVRVANPHLKLVLEVSDAKGTRDISFEGHSRNNLYRRGWRPGMLNVGDKITITIASPRDGGDGGYVSSVITKDGNEF